MNWEAVSSEAMNWEAFRDGLAVSRVDENLVALRSVDSTNDHARRLLGRLGERCPAVTIVAWRQDRGRGRLGASWASPAGRGIYASMVRRLPGDRLLAVPLLVGVGLATALGRATGLDCRLKWPNDLLAAGRKLGGVLIETVTRTVGEEAAVVIGFGINLGHDRAALPGPTATSVALEIGATPTLAPLLSVLVAAIDGELRHLGEEGYAGARFAELMVHRLGDHLTCRLAEETVTGELLGFDLRGFLRLRVEGRERRLAAALLEEPPNGAPTC